MWVYVAVSEGKYIWFPFKNPDYIGNYKIEKTRY